MQQKTKSLKIFISSPHDVPEERQLVSKVINELNHSVAPKLGFFLQETLWEKDAWPDVIEANDEDVQDMISRQIRDYDHYVGIMWKRFGTPTARAGSGTEEEFNQAFELNQKYGHPSIFLYFCKRPFFPDLDDLSQIRKVLCFQKKVRRHRKILYWEYISAEQFEDDLRQHLIKKLFEYSENEHANKSVTQTRFSLVFFRMLRQQLDKYATMFRELQRDYERNLREQTHYFGVDFSELVEFMHLKPSNERAIINRYIFDNLDVPFTLMPGALGELLFFLEKQKESLETIPSNFLQNEAVQHFIHAFSSGLSDDEHLLGLYGEVEEQLGNQWLTLFDALSGIENSGISSLKKLILDNKLTPVQGIHDLAGFPKQVLELTEKFRKYLDRARSEKELNNRIDSIDFGATWLLDTQAKDDGEYYTVFTQSTRLIRAYQASAEFRLNSDYLFRNAEYLKCRTNLQTLFADTEARLRFVAFWAEECNALQRDITKLIQLENQQLFVRPNVEIIYRLQRFDEECRGPLEFSGDLGQQELVALRQKAGNFLTIVRDTGKYLGGINEAFETYKLSLQEMRDELSVFSPKDLEAQKYMNQILKWLDS